MLRKKPCIRSIEHYEALREKMLKSLDKPFGRLYDFFLVYKIQVISIACLFFCLILMTLFSFLNILSYWHVPVLGRALFIVFLTVAMTIGISKILGISFVEKKIEHQFDFWFSSPVYNPGFVVAFLNREYDYDFLHNADFTSPLLDWYFPQRKLGTREIIRLSSALQQYNLLHEDLLRFANQRSDLLIRQQALSLYQQHWDHYHQSSKERSIDDWTNRLEFLYEQQSRISVKQDLDQKTQKTSKTNSVKRL